MSAGFGCHLAANTLSNAKRAGSVSDELLVVKRQMVISVSEEEPEALATSKFSPSWPTNAAEGLGVSNPLAYFPYVHHLWKLAARGLSRSVERAENHLVMTPRRKMS